MACTPSRGGRAFDLHPIDRDRLADVLDLLLPHRLKAEREFRFNLLRHLAGNADAARVGKLLQAGGDVDTVAMPISALHDHFAEVDANANIDALTSGSPAFRSAIPRWMSTAHSTASTTLRELGEKTIAHELEDAAAMLRYCRFNEFIAVSLDPLKGFRFVLLHQAAVADDISGKNGGELAFHERAPLANPILC